MLKDTVLRLADLFPISVASTTIVVIMSDILIMTRDKVQTHGDPVLKMAGQFYNTVLSQPNKIHQGK